jgi:hypothetical protein
VQNKIISFGRRIDAGRGKQMGEKSVERRLVSRCAGGSRGSAWWLGRVVAVLCYEMKEATGRWAGGPPNGPKGQVVGPAGKTKTKR